jgi:hypothetical protein
MSTPPTTKLHLFFASNSDRAVILRQGPNELSRLMLWHREPKTFEDGRWIKHRVYADHSDLSPEWQHFLYCAFKDGWADETKAGYSALSRPPYFTTLALFPMGHTWDCDGVFLNGGTQIADGEGDIIGRANGLGSCTRTWDRDIWAYVLDDPNGSSCDPADFRAGLHKPEPPTSAACTHPDYTTKDARPYRRRARELTLIRGFTDMRFSAIQAPHDWRDPGNSGHTPWNPLHGDEP